MKQNGWPRKASFLTLTLFTLLNIFTVTNSYASGAKLPEVTDGTVLTDSSDNPLPPTGGGTSTTPPSTGGGSLLASSLNRPWAKSGTSIVIDAYEGNSIDWAKMAADKKVVGVIHRSSIGSRLDGLYQSRKKIARERGYLWGAYHLGYRGNTIAQADLFLSLVKDEPETLMVLDLENTSATNLMSVDEAVVFMDRVYEKTGRTPVVYANQSTTQLLNQKVKNNPRFQEAKLWYARFKPTVTDFPKGIWSNYFLWQFSSELNCSSTGSCLYNVPGTKFDMDINVFYGSPGELEAQWNNN
ncbi:MAG: glycoside hydrolase family 25 protein [Bacteriovorax sp.]|jgi:GH25 family lysozyme M1 (1,4-beta-N-acetylmuramidase)